MQMGGENWTNFLKEFYKSYKGKVITLDDFVNLIDKFDPSKVSSANLINNLTETGQIN